ncbi:MAG: GAF domain-containing protein [Cytophagales bacterium]
MKKNKTKSIVGGWFFWLMLFLWGCVVLCVYIVFSIININKYNDWSNHIDNILISSQKCTVAAKEFLMNAYTDETFVKTGSNESFVAFNRNMDSVLVLTQEFEKSDFINNEDKKQAANDLDSDLNTYKYGFFIIAELFKQKGFRESGLEGELRKSVQYIETNETPADYEYLLVLRKHEKDFLLTKDIKYTESFNADVERFIKHVQSNSKYDPSQKDRLKTALETYQSTFQQIIDIESQIGLNQNEGFRSEITMSLESIETILGSFYREINEKKAQASYTINIIIISIIVVFVLIISGVFFSVNYLNRSIIKPIKNLNDAADQIAHGNLSVNLGTIRNNKLMADLVLSYEKLIEKMRSTISQIELITARKISSVFELHNESDEVGKSLNRIISELKTIDAQEANRNWAAEGLTKFGDIIRSNQDFNTLCDTVISFLVKYLDAQLGGLYVVKALEDRDVLNLEAGYAYNRKKFISKSIEKGEGLVGQCFEDADFIYITDIPDEYIKITSGLGDSNPQSLLLAPMISSERVEAVLELASFNEFEDFQIEFLKKIGEILASTLKNVKINEMTSSLLEESKMQSEQMRAQEEEMRQNLEEMVATQEEISRNEQTYKSRIIYLEAENERLRLQNGKMQTEHFSLQ